MHVAARATALGTAAPDRNIRSRTTRSNVRRLRRASLCELDAQVSPRRKGEGSPGIELRALKGYGPGESQVKPERSHPRELALPGGSLVKGPGRPTKEEVAERRHRVRTLLVVRALEDDEAIAGLGERLGVGERAIRSDLEALREELQTGNRRESPEGLIQAIEAADSFRLLKSLGKTVMREMAQGRIERELGSALVDAIREQRQVLVKARDEEAEASVMALEILTPQEQAILDTYRKSLVPPALKPGEFPPPPEGAPLPKASALPLSSASATGGSESARSGLSDDVEDSAEEIR
ncbi:MAG TPA: hypothetical protein VFF73_40315 [Planctomycetota bacterium]|nr:hypothetical protein [Planctomycetota bacterium]